MTQKNLMHDRESGFVTGAKWCISPNQDERPEGIDIDVLVIHAISLPPDTFGGQYISQFFTNRLDSTEHPYFAEIADLRVSSHFLINRAGELIQFVSTRNRAWHAGVSCFRGRERVNDFSVGVELEGCDSLPFMAMQYDMLVKLTLCLMQSHSAINAGNIVGHNQISPGRKTDPGPCFDWSQYKERIS